MHLPAALLTLLYAAALAVAVVVPGAPTLAGLVVLTGLVARPAARRLLRRRALHPAVVVPAPAVVADAARAA